MCGICGVIGSDEREEGSRVLARMLEAIFHRGPDEEGRLVAPRFAAGIRRLSIIDLAGGQQPIWNETSTLAICFNGEIYNFESLRSELAAAGHQFRTRSDTEVIVHAYEQWGTAGLARLAGMFAFVLAEMPEGPSGPVTRAILARDRFGIKPLYYALRDGKLIFGSEVRAIVASGIVPAEISPEAVRSYLFFGSVGEPDTLVDGIFMLPPGHFTEISVDAPPSRAITSTPFWSVSEIDNATLKSRRISSPAQQTRALLEASVRSHLVADVPVGVFLSSGLDSTAIAALAARIHPGIHTFTVAFPDLEFSEAEPARRTAERLGTTHSEIELSAEQMLRRLDEAVAAFDQPSMDGVNTYFVSWAARQSGLKVALSGLGSDEIFGGYPTFRSTASVARLTGLARLTPRALRAVAAATARAVRSKNGSAAMFEKAAAAWMDPGEFAHPYFYTRTLFTPQQVARAVRDGKPPGLGPLSTGGWLKWLCRAASEAEKMDAFTAISWLELRSYMLNTLLRDTDAMSMASSLEVRVPFLDPDLVEYVLALPETCKRAPGRPKFLLIDALGDLLPAELSSQRKRTFTFPWEKWLQGPLGEHVSAGLREWSPKLARVLSQEFAEGVWGAFQAGHTTWSRPWSLYVLNQWSKRQLGGARSPSAAPSSAATTC